MFFSFSPGALIEAPIAGEEQLSIDETLEPLTVTETSEGIISGFSLEEVVEVKGGSVPTLEEMQEIFDDISEIVDILNQEVIELVEARLQPTEKIEEIREKTEELEEKEEVVEEVVEEAEEVIEVTEEDDELVGDNLQQTEKEVVLCERSGWPARNKVILNEIAWMGTNNSANDEWVELKNISVVPVNLVGWQLLDKENQIQIIFSQETISANELFLLERTDDDSVSEVVADLIYTGALANTNDALYLFDENCQLQDEVLATPDWSAGDNSSKRTMERKTNLSWQTGANSGGTPKRENSSGYTPYYGGGGGGVPSSPSPSPEESSSPPSPPEILISEIQIASSSNTKDEFIEIYNPNQEEVNLFGWSIQKTYSNSTTTYKKNFESENKIPAKGYFLIVNSNAITSLQALAESNGMIHNSFSLAENNTIYLVSDNEEIENVSDVAIIDMVGFGTDIVEFRSLPAEGDSPALNPSTGKSIGRKWSTTTENYIDTDNNQNDFEIQTPTPGVQNQSPVVPENQLPTA